MYNIFTVDIVSMSWKIEVKTKVDRSSKIMYNRLSKNGTEKFKSSQKNQKVW